MKRYLGIVIAIIFVVVTIVFASKKWTAKVVESDRDANMARIRLEYMERVGWIRANPDEKSYRDEVGTYLRWYFTQINDHQNRFGGNKKYDDYLQELDKRAEKGGNDSKRNEKKAAYENVKKMFDLMREGRYQPMWSAADRGMRLDVLPTTTVNDKGETKVSFPVVVWGAQRELRDDGKLKKMVTSANWRIGFKLTDEKGKLIGEMNVDGDPSDKVDYPERFIAEFPPQMYFGHYDLDLLPENTRTVEINFTVISRSPTGGDIPANFVWKLDAPAEWKLRAGQEWKGAQESVRPEEEIDPAAAAKKQAKR